LPAPKKSGFDESALRSQLEKQGISKQAIETILATAKQDAEKAGLRDELAKLVDDLSKDIGSLTTKLKHAAALAKEVGQTEGLATLGNDLRAALSHTGTRSAAPRATGTGTRTRLSDSEKEQAKAQIKSLVGDAGGQGVNATVLIERTGLSANHVRSLLGDLIESGDVFRAGERRATRYWGKAWKADAEAYGKAAA